MPKKSSNEKINRPIEEYFPIHQVNRIANKESKAKRWYRPVYTMHKWWARRLGSVFRTILLYSLADEHMRVIQNDGEIFDGKMWDGDPKSLWDFYLEDVDFEGKTVLDPFFGGGTTIVEALRMGCNVVGSELNPVAWFVTKKEIELVDLEKLDRAFKELEETIAPEIKRYYKTTCPHCKQEADAMYYFWVKVLPCLNCGSEVPLFKSYRVASIRPQKVLDDELNGAKSGYWIYCPKCATIFPVSNYREEAHCPNCSHSLYPEKGNTSGKYYTCPDCGHKDVIIETIRKNGKPQERMYAVEYYCSRCDAEDNPHLMNGKGYKPIGEKDLQLFQKAKDEFQEIESQLPIPNQDIPKGKETHPRLENHGYKKFRDMFNDRQLLNLGKLLHEIKKIEDANIKELLLLPFSKALNSNNQLCKYSNNHVIRDMFSSHAFHPSTTPVENNVWGVKYGARTFRLYYKNLEDGKKYCANPVERGYKKGKLIKKEMKVPIEGVVSPDFLQLGDSKNTILYCGDSSYLPIPDKSVDLIVTDPPYFDNVMYSELSDFYYVWLRESLKESYDYFNANLTPKSSEIVKNRSMNKSANDFTLGLIDVMKESHKKLKDNGLMIFTFHHSDTTAWASVLNSVLESGFFITAVYPIQAEMSTSTHIHSKGNIEYDMIIICRKRGKVIQKTSWEKIYDRIYFKAHDTIKELETETERLALGDMFVIAMGKCLEEFSKHYPNVYYKGKRLTVQEALDDIRAIVDTHFMEGRFDEFQRKLDTPSAAYLTFLATGSDKVSYTSLNKRLQQRAISIEDFLKWGMAKQEGSKIVKLDLEDRAEFIEQKKSQNVSAIDRAHYIQYLKEVKDDPAAIKNWATDDAVVALDELSKLQKSKDLRALKEFIEQKEYTKSQAKQERLL